MRVVDQRYLNSVPSVIYTEITTYCMSGAYWKDPAGDDYTEELVAVWQRREAEYLKKYYAE